MKIKSVVCGNCGRIHGKYSKPWRVCTDCNKTFCLTCIPERATDSCCPKCRDKKWNKECKEKEKIRKSTPVECVVCHQKKLIKHMANPYVPSVCKKCDNIQKALREKERKNNSRPGLVQVIYGERNIPTKNCDSGYAYYFDQPLNLGDIVEVPQTWLGALKEEGNRKLATVVSTYSDYQGNASSIIRVVKTVKERKTEETKIGEEETI